MIPEIIFKSRSRNFLLLYSEFFNEETIELFTAFLRKNEVAELKVSKFNSIDYEGYTPDDKRNLIRIPITDLSDYFFLPIWENNEREYYLDYCYIESIDCKINILIDKSMETVIIGVSSDELDNSFEKTLNPYKEVSLQEKLNYLYDALFYDKKKGQIFVKKLIENYFKKEASLIVK